MEKVRIEILKGTLKGQVVEAKKYEARVGTVYQYTPPKGQTRQFIAKNVREI